MKKRTKPQPRTEATKPAKPKRQKAEVRNKKSSRQITERKQAENELRRSSRTLQMLSRVNQVLVRANQESQLLDTICRIPVEDGDYRMAWIGFAEQDDAKSVRLVAQAGFEAGYLDTLNIT